jgi:hypothetical protein
VNILPTKGGPTYTIVGGEGLGGKLTNICEEVGLLFFYGKWEQSLSGENDLVHLHIEVEC